MMLTTLAAPLRLRLRRVESLSSMVAKDADDEALTKWKQSLLAGTTSSSGR